MAKSKRGKSQSRPDYIKWALLAGTAVIIAVLAVLLYRHYRPNVNVDRYPVRGIDVSKHNGSIDWQRVADSGIRFVYIKATEGISYRNPLLNDQYSGARKAGLKVGCYHFFRMNRGGVEQAQHFIRTVGNRHLDLPLVIDVEESDNDNSVDRTTILQNLKLMARELQHRGFKVMFYTNGNGYKTYYQGHLDDYELWLSAFRAPESIAYLGHTMQQYSHWGSVDGVDSDVDLNIFIGSEDQWLQWLKQVNQ